MPSPLVESVRAVVRDADRPLTPVERVLIAATLARPVAGGADALTELEAAITAARPAIRRTPEGDPSRRLLLAAIAVLDPAIPIPHDTTATAPEVDRGGRPARADIDA